MVDGQLAVNTNNGSPGLFFKDAGGALVKVGPVHVGITAPNASPAVGGTAGNSVGEQWLDTTGGTYVFKVWDGSAWRSESGTFVDASGDVMTGALVMDNQQQVRFRETTANGTHYIALQAPALVASDKTITLPDVTGTVVTTGDTGTVISTMIADGTISNGEISTTAAIAHSKLANITAGSVLFGNASNVPTATALSGDLTVNSTGVTTLASTGTAGTYTKVTTDAKGRVSSGTTLSATDIPTLTAAKISDFDTEVQTNSLDQMAVPTAAVSLNSQKITNLATPTADSDAATKAYVDAVKQGLDIKDSVRAATTANITLSALQTIDGVAVVAGNRVLVKDQTTASANGIYVVAAGSWTRATDADTNTEVTAGLFVFVTEGTANADSGWVLTTEDAITLGTTALSFSRFSGAGQITAGAGLTKTGNTLDAVGTANRITVNADSIDIASTYSGQTSITTLGTIATGTWTGTTIAVANGGTGVTTSTGSGSTVLSTSPSLTTPLLGTPTSGTLTNCTGYTFANVTSKPTTLSGYSITDAATSTHVHGNITNAGAIGSTANLPIITGTAGALQAGSFGTAANTFCQGNDARLSDTRTPTDGSVTDAKVSASAGISDTKLGTISTAGKVSNSATTATSANTASAIVARDASGNFTAGTITGTFSGTTFLGTTSLALNRASANQALTGISSIALPGSTSGTTTLQPSAVAGTTAITFPATTGTVITTGDSGTISGSMIAAAAIAYSKLALAGSILNADIAAAAAIADTKLATIDTAGKVSNSATTATNANTPSAIVARDPSGNFTAGTITAALTGNASTSTTLATARNIQGVSFNGSANITVVTAGTGISVTGTAVANTGVLSVNGSTGAVTGLLTSATAATTYAPLASPTFTGTVTFPSGQAYPQVPQNARTAAYTLTASDAGRHVSITTGGITIPTAVFAVGDAISIYNNSTSSQTITQGASTTLRLAGSTLTGNRTIAQYGLCTILCVASNVFVISGGGLS
jgi:phage-related tail fiber protein